MDIDKVNERLAALSGMDSEELDKRRTLVEDACDYVQRRCKAAQPDEGQQRRLEALSAACAWRFFNMSGDNLKQFIAGDVHLTAFADGAEAAERYWRELLRQNSDLIDTDEFLFGRVTI